MMIITSAQSLPRNNLKQALAIWAHRAIKKLFDEDRVPRYKQVNGREPGMSYPWLPTQRNFT